MISQYSCASSITRGIVPAIFYLRSWPGMPTFMYWCLALGPSLSLETLRLDWTPNFVHKYYATVHCYDTSIILVMVLYFSEGYVNFLCSSIDYGRIWNLELDKDLIQQGVYLSCKVLKFLQSVGTPHTVDSVYTALSPGE